MSARPAQTLPRTRALPDADQAHADRVLSARTIDRITRFHGDGLPVVSAYLAVSPGRDARRVIRAKANSLLHRVRSLARDRSLDHDARVSLRGDIERIEEVARREFLAAGTLAVFSCSGAGLLEVVRLPRAIRDRIMVDATAWVGPMLAVLDQHHRCCAVVVDHESAHAWELYLGELREVGSVVGRALRDPAYAGWHGLSERRVRDKADELAKRHFREVAAALDRLFRSERYEVLAVGGHEHELPGFLEFLPRWVRERLAGTFSIDPHTAAAATVRPHAEAILERYELGQQRRAVEELLESAAAGGLAAVGLGPCLAAGSVAAIRTLLVHDGAVAPGVVCDASGWFGTTGEACPLCGGPTRRTLDVIDELLEAVIDEGGSVRHVRADTDLRDRLTAAWLRFALPPIAERT
jgi:peptide chain release factor subunit 1